MNVDMNPHQTTIYFNVHTITSVFFGSGIVCLTDAQEKELKWIWKEPILMKLGMSKKFTRTASCSRKSALDLELMEPSTITCVLKLKLFIGTTRKIGNVAKYAQCQLEY